MDNSTILYNAIQRAYRNAVVDHVRKKMTAKFGVAGTEEVKKLFGKKNPELGKTYWESIHEAAHERRSGGTGELSTPIRDDFEILGVEHFFTVFEAHFDVLCPNHADKPKSDKQQARSTVTTWMKQIKNVRDPVSHPVTDDIDFEDSTHVLFCARKVLDFCGLPEASAQVISLQSALLGGIAAEPDKILAVLPPADEVVMDFVGRHNELAKLNEWLDGKVSRRWALSGDGGKGKSSIAYAFARSVAARDNHNLDAVIWMSAKRRRFIEGETVLVDRPDFYDKQSASKTILNCFGEKPTDSDAENEDKALLLLSDFPSLLIIDDIDTVEDQGEDAIQFLVMSIPERTKSRVLLTSRRALFGMANLTTQIGGLSARDGEDFIKSRCVLMGISIMPVLALKEQLLQVTDSSPLYIEDLLRLTQSGLPIEKAIGLWAEKRGNEARKYAVQREYDQLTEDAKQVLLALALQGPCRSDDICRGLNWPEDRLVTSLQQLRNMFLMPEIDTSTGHHHLALNRNLATLVIEVFRGSAAFRRTERFMKAAKGELQTKRSEDLRVEACLRRARLLVRENGLEEAESIVANCLKDFPARADIYATLAWINKKRRDFASARMHFIRAHELGSRDPDMYWHWSEMEAGNLEWKASADAAALGVEKFGDGQGLLYRQGYALLRHGRELIVEEKSPDGKKFCCRAKAILAKAANNHGSEDRNYTLRSQIARAVALNLETLEEWSELADHFTEWGADAPQDPYFRKEYQRLRHRL